MCGLLLKSAERNLNDSRCSGIYIIINRKGKVFRIIENSLCVYYTPQICAPFYLNLSLTYFGKASNVPGIL